MCGERNRNRARLLALLQNLIQAAEAFDESLFFHAEAQTEVIGDSKEAAGCDGRILLQQLGHERIHRAISQVNEADRARIRCPPRQLGVAGQEILDEGSVFGQPFREGGQDVVGVI